MDISTQPSACLPSDPELRANLIRDEQVKVIYRYLPVLLAINAAVSGAMVYGLWQVVSRTGLVVWASVMAFILVMRGALYVAYRHAPADSSQKIWAIAFTLGSGASGLAWGAVGVFLFPAGSLEYQLFILFILMGMGAGAVSSLTAYMPAFYAFLPVSLFPIGVMLMWAGDPIHIALGTMTFVYALGLGFFGRTINRILDESLRLRFQNVDLVHELSQQRDAAERANIAKSKFLAAASHDLRQPLHALTLFTTALNERIKYPEVSKIVGNINESVHALEKLFNALLDVSRLDAGVLQPEKCHFRIAALCRRLINDYAPAAEVKGLMLDCAACDIVVHSDPALLERILRNYLSNAVRYTDQGEVRIDCVLLGREVRIDVTDSGIGIPLEHQRDIFSEFYQLGNPERDRTKGLGLGLAIVDRVARLLRHPIDVQSAPGKGSCFSVTVPIGDPLCLSAEAPTQTDVALNDLIGLRVLVVDDEISVREGMRTLLDQWGCELMLAGSEDEAVAAVRVAGTMPDALLVDYRLRDERTGVQAIERLQRELHRAIPALIVTGDTAPKHLREAKASGYQLVHKPMPPAVLRVFLRHVSHSKRVSLDSASINPHS